MKMLNRAGLLSLALAAVPATAQKNETQLSIGTGGTGNCTDTLESGSDWQHAELRLPRGGRIARIEKRAVRVQHVLLVLVELALDQAALAFA